LTSPVSVPPKSVAAYEPVDTPPMTGSTSASHLASATLPSAPSADASAILVAAAVETRLASRSLEAIFAGENTW